MKITQLSLLALACAAVPAAGLAQVQIGVNIAVPEVVVRSAPPPERYEAIGVAPGPGYVYIRGHWGWHHERWEWIGGRWEVPAQPGAQWIPGQWVVRGGGYVWIEGHYTTNVVVAAPPPPPAPAVVYVNEAPPAPVYENVPVAPGPEFFWIGGHWSWQGRWVWAHGYYDRHPHFHPGGGWEAGHWDHEGGRFVWHEGHWR